MIGFMTPRQEKAFTRIRSFFERRERMPSYQEIASLMKYASKQAAHKIVDKLMEEGWIGKDDKGHLTPLFLKTGHSLIGYVQAGFPSPAEEELIDTLTLDQYLVPKPNASFLLKVTGDSMTGAGIFPGDIVIIERGKTPKNDEIVLAEIDGEWTLKFFRKKGKQVILVPANPKYPELTPREELKIAGTVSAVVRKYL